jgi:hypothetical protein
MQTTTRTPEEVDAVERMWISMAVETVRKAQRQMLDVAINTKDHKRADMLIEKVQRLNDAVKDIEN